MSSFKNRFIGLPVVLICLAGCRKDVDGAQQGSQGEPARASVSSAADHRPISPPGQLDPSRTTPIYSRDVAPLLDQYCLHCHDRATARGEIVLEGLGDECSDPKTRSLLTIIADNLKSMSMPPEGEPRPDPQELETINAWLDEALATGEATTSRVVIRRLNRAEYNNTIRDLIGLDLHPADEFPADDVGYGFDNIAEVLSTPPILVEMYVAAADMIVREAFANAIVRARLMSPPADRVPRVFRKYTPPVRSPRTEKVLLTAAPAPDAELSRQQRIYDILRAFCDRAFRRPATHDELTRLLAIVLSAEKDGESAESSLQLALQAALVSPQFLFIHARPMHDAGSTGDSIALSDFDLAARLSYFLWSSMPDEELTHLAAQGALRRGDNLSVQIRRMLRDKRSSALADNFSSQWLQTRKLGQFTPDPVLFPNFDQLLRAAILGETRLFCESILREDRSVLDFLAADYTFANERLARHYGIDGVVGDEFSRVSLTGTARGGVLTHASILAATSNPTRTSPVKRGKWILENILGMPPAPPPSGVEALKDGADHATSATLRQRMERHRADPACAACHRRMDPLGFGLENFDAVGAWRVYEGGQTIDTSGQLPGGRAFQNSTELRSVLLSYQDAFARCLTEKMLTYALGRGLDRTDRRHVDQIVAELARDDYRFSTLIVAVAKSEPFLNFNSERASR